MFARPHVFTSVLSCLLLFLAGTITNLGAAPVSKVTIESKPKDAINASYIRQLIKTKTDRQFNENELSEDIKRIFKTGVADDVEVKVEDLADDTKHVKFIIDAVPVVSDIRISGNENVKTKHIKKELSLVEGDLLSTAKLRNDKRALHDLYEQKGYSKTGISFRTEKIDAYKVSLIWQINEPTRRKVKTVEFNGNIVYSTGQLRKHVQTGFNPLSLIFQTGHLDKNKLQRDKDRLRNFYTSRGYLDFYIKSVETNVNPGSGRVSVVFNIHEGLPYTVGSVKLEGNTVFPDSAFKPFLQLRKGMTYNSELEREDRLMIENKYGPKGYFDIRCIADLDKDPENQVVDITYRIFEGESATVQDIRITNNEVTKDEVIRRELAIQPGMPLSKTKLRRSKSRLMNLRYFETVEMLPRSTPEPGVKDLEVRVKETETGRLSLGAGLSTDGGLMGNFELGQSNFDLFNWPTFQGDGQRFRIKMSLGTERNSFSFSFVEPWLFDKRLRFGLKGYSTIRDNDEYDEERIGGSTDLTNQIRFEPTWPVLRFLDGNWRQTLGYRLEKINITDMDDDVGPTLAVEEDDYTASVLKYSLSQDTRNNFMHPTRGAKHSASLEFGTEALGSYSDIYKLQLSSSKYFPFRELGPLGETVLKLEGNVGVVDGVDGDDPAIFDRFFAGGQSSLRGFDYRDISPTDNLLNPIGGQSMLLGTAELMKPLNDIFNPSIFCDVGNVWADAYEFDMNTLNMSVGVGLLMNFQMMPIRLDYGYPIEKQAEHLDDGGQLHFNIGYSW
jgi:outer membrane protein insertion porin family